MKSPMKNAHTTIITLGVIVALLAVFLTPGFSPITEIFGNTDLTKTQESISKPIFEKVKNESVAAVSNFLKEVNLN